MTQTEYENKRAECWEEFKKLDRKSPYSLRDVNAFAFDRGYALQQTVRPMGNCSRTGRAVERESQGHPRYIDFHQFNTYTAGDMNNNPNPQSSESQCKKILTWLQQGNTLTPIEALNQFGCFRLASRINDLRQRGIDICKRMVKNPDNGKRYAEYYINPEQS